MNTGKKLLQLIATMLLSGATVFGQKVIYVNQNATSGGDGTSWSEAFQDLQEALAIDEDGDEIWIAKGTYTPELANGSRSVRFNIDKSISIFGGFYGNETALDQRMGLEINPTILSGDLNGDDESEGNDENSYHVIYISNTGNVHLEDLIIEGGNANGTGGNRTASALNVSNNSTGTFSYEIINCQFRNHHDEYSGAVSFGGGANAILNVSIANAVFENLSEYAISSTNLYGVNIDVINPTMVNTNGIANLQQVGVTMNVVNGAFMNAGRLYSIQNSILNVDNSIFSYIPAINRHS